jgi:indole-3-glycerol phosphate synthase
MHNILVTIVEKKKKDIEEQKKLKPLEVIKNEVFQLKTKSKKNLFFNSFSKNKKEISLIAEIKFASPTNSHLGSHDELLERAIKYEKAGADVISLITEKYYFKGDGAFISQAKKHVAIPVLQKDFVIDPYQIYEAKQFGSDALLLIARLVEGDTLKEFVKLCLSLEIEPVVEINSQEDLKKASETEANIIAVNARDLETFDIDVEKACVLIEKIPTTFIKLGFSGISSSTQVLQFEKSGVDGVLVGTSLMRTDNIDGFIKSLKI